MYKISKFTFSTMDCHDMMLLYNTYCGRKSFCKVCDEQAIRLIQKNKIDELESDVLMALLNKGIVVNSNEDENKKLYSQYLDAVVSKKLSLIINPTEQCNFRCKYCYETFKNGFMSKEVQKKLVNFVKNNIHKYAGFNVSWFGGEPLLAKKEIENLSKQFMQICSFYKKPYRAMMTTNGYFLDESTFQKLLSLHINRFQITIDGIPLLHDNQRITITGEGTYNRILQNLKAIKNLRTRNFSILLRTNFTRELFSHIGEYLNNISALCENDKRFSVFCYKVGKWSASISPDIESILVDDVSGGMKKIYNEILKSEKQVTLDSDFLEPGSGLCYGGRKNHFVVSSDGTIHKCTINFEDPMSIVGNLFDDRIELNNQYYHYIANPSKCPRYYSCFFAPVCTGDPCPLKEKVGSNCSFVKDNLDLILQILDKYEPFPVIV